MANRLPTLFRYQLRQHALAASVTVGLTLVMLLMLADQLALRAAAHALAMDLRSGEETMLAEGNGRGRGGRLVLDAQGVPLRGVGPMFMGGRGAGWGPMHRQDPWTLASTVVVRGTLQGTGTLPWTPEPVVWAARAVPQTSGDPHILLAWTRIGAIRAAAGTTYLLVVMAIALAFLVSMAFTRRTILQVSRAVMDVTTAGRQMAGGNFAVHVPPQVTRELDELRTVIVELASHLDHTLTDLRGEHTRLARLEQAQRQFVADASHELRAPLSAMALTLDAWHDGLLRAEEQSEAVALLRNETQRLGRLVAQLLDLSRIESGRQPVVLAAIDVRDVCAQVVQAMQGTPGAAMVFDVPPAVPSVLADWDALHRVLRNLLDNARRFTPADGSVRLWAAPEAEGVRIGVTDSGCGIPAELLPHIWDRFARAQHTRSDQDTGVGLGLAIVKALADAMGGRVGIDSTEGVGTTVWVWLAGAEDVSET